MDESLYKLVVGIQIKDQSGSGAREFQKSLEKMSKDASALQEQLDKIKINPKDFKLAEQAQQSINALTEQQANLKKQIALSTDKDAKAALQTQLKALTLTKDGVTAQKNILALDEKRYSWIFRVSRMQAAEDDRKARAAQALADKQAASIKKLADQQAAASQKLLDKQAADAKALADKQIAEAKRVQEAYWRMRGQAIEANLNARLSARANAFEAEAGGLRGFIAGLRHGGGGEVSNALSMLPGVGMLAFGPGLAVGAGLAAGIGAVGAGYHDAADLQTALTTMGIGTNATRAQLEAYRQTAFDISNNTAQSATQSAQIMATMAGAGFNSPDQLIKLSPLLAKFADVQFYKRGTGFEDSAATAFKLAHLYGAVGTDDKTRARLSNLLNEFTNISFMMPDNLNKFVTQAGYYMPTFRHYGVSDDQSLVMGAFIDRMGLGQGKGGTALANFIGNQLGQVAITGSVQGKRAKALEALGLVGSDGMSLFYKNGQFNIIDALTQISKDVDKGTAGLTGSARDRKQLEIGKQISEALGVTGGRIGFLANNDSISLLHQMVGALNPKLHPNNTLDNYQASYMNNLGPSFQRMVTNFQSLMVDVLWPTLGVVAGGFRGVAESLHNLQSYLHMHKTAAAAVRDAVVALGAAATFVAGNQIAGLIAGLKGVGGAAATASAEIGGAEAAAGAGAGAVAGGGIVASISTLARRLFPWLALAAMDDSDFRHPSHISPGSPADLANRRDAILAAQQAAMDGGGNVHLHGPVTIVTQSGSDLHKQVVSHARRGPGLPPGVHAAQLGH